MSDELLRFFSPDAAAAIERRISERVEQGLRQAAPAGDRRFVTVAEAATLLGLTERAVRSHVQRGRLAARRLGTRILIDMDGLDRPAGKG